MSEGKQLNSTAKQILCNVYDYFENRKKKKRKGSVLPCWERRHLKLLIITSELLNTLQRRGN